MMCDRQSWGSGGRWGGGGGVVSEGVGLPLVSVVQTCSDSEG